MIDRLFANSAFIALGQGLDAASLRHQVIANNIANINTSGYKKQEVSFEEEFKRAISGSRNRLKMSQADHRHLTIRGSSAGAVRVSTSSATPMRNDGNNIDIDEEITNMAENNIRFNAMSKLIGGRFHSLRTVIEGR